MTEQDLHERILPGLLVGSNRNELPLAEVLGGGFDPADDDAKLAALSLCGQSLRFARPTAPAAFDERRESPADNRSFLPEHLRTPFIKLVGGTPNENSPLLSAAVAAAMERNGVAPHPFDLEKAEGFVVAHAASLGAFAFSWAQSRNPEAARQEYFDWSRLDDTCWTEASTGQRERFLRERRQADPVAARSLLEADWKNCDAETRFRLVRTLRIGLSETDRAFLSGLAKDRAPRVREEATALLARLGQGEVSVDIKDRLGRVKEDATGVFKKKRVFRLEYPTNVKDDARDRWMFDNFGQLGLGLISRGLECPEEELVAGALKDEGLLFVLLLAATIDKRFGVLETIAKALPDAWSRLAATEFESCDGYDEPELLRWIDAVARPGAWPERTDADCARKLLSLLNGKALPPAQFDALLRSPWTAASLAGGGHPQYRAIELIALLCPPERRENLVRRIVDEEETQPVRWFIQIMTSLEATPHG